MTGGGSVSEQNYQNFIKEPLHYSLYIAGIFFALLFCTGITGRWMNQKIIRIIHKAGEELPLMKEARLFMHQHELAKKQTK